MILLLAAFALSVPGLDLIDRLPAPSLLVDTLLDDRRKGNSMLLRVNSILFHLSQLSVEEQKDATLIFATKVKREAEAYRRRGDTEKLNAAANRMAKLDLISFSTARWSGVLPFRQSFFFRLSRQGQIILEERKINEGLRGQGWAYETGPVFFELAREKAHAGYFVITPGT